MENKNPYTDTTTRQYQNSSYQKTDQGWVKRVEETQQQAAAEASPTDTKKEYSDEQLADFAKKASDEALKKAGAGRDERMRIAAKREILRRKNEGMPEPEKSDNPFDEGLEKGLFDDLPTKEFGGKQYINEGQGWEPLEKGRAAVGEIRVWSGEKYQKTATGWKYLGKDGSGAGKAKEEKKEAPAYNKPWPESLDKLTNRASWDEIHTEAEAVAQVKFDEEYHNPEEDFFKKLIEEDKRYDWRTPHYEDLDNQGKEQWKADRKAEWISREASHIMQPSRRGPALSKTAMIGNVKDAWKAIQNKRDKAKADADYKALLESSEGKARKQAFGNALKENVEDFVAEKNEIKAKLRNTLVEQFTVAGGLSESDLEKMKIRLTGRDTMEISGLTGVWSDDVTVDYSADWDDASKRTYKVRTSSYGSIEPDSKEAKAVLAQSMCLTNPKVIAAVKEAILDNREARKTMRSINNELKAQYPEFRFDEIRAEFIPDDLDFE